MAQVAKGNIGNSTRRRLDFTNIFLVILAIFIGLTLVIDLNLLKPVLSSTADSAQYVGGNVSLDKTQHPTATPDDDSNY